MHHHYTSAIVVVVATPSRVVAIPLFLLRAFLVKNSARAACVKRINQNFTEEKERGGGIDINGVVAATCAASAAHKREENLV